MEHYDDVLRKLESMYGEVNGLVKYSTYADDLFILET